MVNDSGAALFDADVIILGAGPAGLAAAQYGARAALKVLLVERLSPGGQALQIDSLENYPGLRPAKSGFDFAEDMRAQAEAFGAAFRNGAVTRLEKDPRGVFRLELDSGETLVCRAVILATGARHRMLDIPGEAAFSGRGVSYCATCDGPFFKNKNIIVVGGGDAACDEARYLARLSPSVVLIHRRDTLRAQKALARRVLNDERIETRFNTRPLEIRGEGKVQSCLLENVLTGARYEEACAAVFIFAGIVPQTELVPFVEKDSSGFIVTNRDMETSAPGLFAAGDVISKPFRQVITAAAEGAIAAHSAAAYLESGK
jgi:thioredoxin reductase (NADPH)